jgi:hypothetical protein
MTFEGFEERRECGCVGEDICCVQGLEEGCFCFCTGEAIDGVLVSRLRDGVGYERLAPCPKCEI